MRNLSLLPVLFLASCGGIQGFDPIPAILTTLQGGQIVSGVLAQNALDAQAWEACVASTVTGSVLRVAQDAILDRTEIPELSVDVSACLAFNPDFTPGDISSPSVVHPIRAAVSTLETVGSFLTVWRDDLCEKAPVVFFLHAYLDSSIPEILSEILAPDGVVTISAVPLDVNDCR